MLNKQAKIYVKLLFGILFFNAIVGFSQQTIDSTTVKAVPDSSSKTRADSTKQAKNVNKIIAAGSSEFKSDTSTIKKEIGTLKPDSTTKDKIKSKILPGGSATLPDSSTKAIILNKVHPPGLTKIITDTTKNKSGIRNKISNTVTYLLPDSNTRKRVLQKLMPKTHGNVSAGYDYGVIPFATNASYPLGYFKTQGNVGISILGLPLLATFYYSDLKNVSGLNNYFRVSFDKTAYDAMLRNKGLSKVEMEAKELSSLSDIKQMLQQKLAFSELYKNGLPTESSLTGQLPNLKNNYNGLNTDSLTKPNVPAVSDSALLNSAKDSLRKKLPSTSIKKTTIADSIDKVTSLLHKYDSLNEKVNQYKSQIQKIDEKIKAINNKLAYFKNPQNLIENNPYLKKFQSIMSGVKKLDIGMSYPNYSTFLVSGSSIKGINVEWEKKFYFAFTYGKTINTVMTTSNLIQNQLQTARNMYNFFDFTNVKDSRKILATKFGYGKKETTHLYAGFLYGLGLPSYVSVSTQTTIEKNLVIELDGRVALNKTNTLDIIYGKSALYQDGVNVTGDNSNAQFPFPFSKYRSNAGLLKYTSEFKKTKTKITATGKIVDPFFNSYGVGFMRSDNLRYELKVEQDITSKIKFSGSYRKDRDNLLNTFSCTTDLQTIVANLNVKLNKRFTAKLSYMPVIQNIKPTSNDSGLQTTHHVNNISTVVITYAPKITQVSSFFNAMYSYYQLTGTAGKNNNFQNYNINNTTIFNQHIKANFAFNYFFNNDSDSLNNSTSLFSADVVYATSKGTTVTLGGKYAYNNIIKQQTGGVLKINIPIIKHINLEVFAEKLVLGDFYNNYNISEIKKFPFYCYGKVILSW